MTLRVTTQVKIGGEGKSGALVIYFDPKRAMNAEIWRGYTKSGGYTEAIDVSRYGMMNGDAMLVQAQVRHDEHDYAEVRQISVHDRAYVVFDWSYIQPPTQEYVVDVYVTHTAPDPSYTGEYWQKNPDEIPVIDNAPLTGVRMVVKQGFTTVIDQEITAADGHSWFMLYPGDYSITLSRATYNTLRDTFTITDRGIRLDYHMTPVDGPEGINVQSWMDEHLTWQNLLKAGVVVVLVSAGSKAFREFKEAFKK